MHSLFLSYPRPHVSDGLLKKLNDISALMPPVEWSGADENLKGELEEMMRLVETVELVDIDAEKNHEQSTFSNSETSKKGGAGLKYEAGAKDNANSVILDDQIWSGCVEMTLSSNSRLVESEDRLQLREGSRAASINYVKYRRMELMLLKQIGGKNERSLPKVPSFRLSKTLTDAHP